MSLTYKLIVTDDPRNPMTTKSPDARHGSRYQDELWFYYPENNNYIVNAFLFYIMCQLGRNNQETALITSVRNVEVKYQVKTMFDFLLLQEKSNTVQVHDMHKSQPIIQMSNEHNVCISPYHANTAMTPHLCKIMEWVESSTKYPFWLTGSFAKNFSTDMITGKMHGIQFSNNDDHYLMNMVFSQQHVDGLFV